MAKSNAVWGIDIGQCALKALRCRPHEKDPTRIVAESFDYVEYPKILSQPEADRPALIADAIEQFLSRNEIKNDRIAVSVPGQAGLSRFIKLPPVEKKKIPDIVKFEARQQIPFALEDVVWDYQQLAGGNEEEGYALEVEVGLFAMKRDQVTRSLKPLTDAGVDVDLIQLAPLSIYNYLCFDQLGDLKENAYNPEAPPSSTIVISFGADTTDLVISNGYRVWQRNIPIGGNHFTKALSKELKLTFSKAEHLKRHATEADDPKAVFQAMRPVFSDLLAEIQRSIGYFTSIYKTAKIGNVIALGNAMKLPGLQRYLAQNLEQQVVPIKEFKSLVGGSVTTGPQFTDNLLSFAVSYGLCIQGLGKGELGTNLLPEDIVTERLIRAKKPWALAGIAALLVGCTINYVAETTSLRSTQGKDLTSAITQAASVKSRSDTFTSDLTATQEKFAEIAKVGTALVSNNEGRLRWLELLKAMQVALPKAEPDNADEISPSDTEKLAAAISARRELHITSMDSEFFEDVSTWYPGIAKKYKDDLADEDIEKAALAPAAADTTPPADGTDPADPNAAPGPANPDGAGDTIDTSAEEAPADPGIPPEEDGSFAEDGMEGDGADGEVSEGPTGTGWIVELRGYHYHNGFRDDEGAHFIRKTLLRNLRDGEVMLPDPLQPGKEIAVLFKDVVISYPVIAHYGGIKAVSINLDSNEPGAVGGADAGGERGGTRPGAGARPGDDALLEPKMLKMKRCEFVIQFCWQPKTPTERLKGPENGEGSEQGEDSF